jgi:murein L,D-transpeptidase YafK
MIMIFNNSHLSRKICGFLQSVLLFILVPILDLGSAYADSVKQPIDKQQDVPAFILEWQSEPDYAIAVDKSQQKVMVYRSDNLLAPVKVYLCSTGENDGPKDKRNDRKTPEGIYFFTNFYLGENLAPIYGSRALPINYPNVIDQMEGKEGYGIWFHGTNKPITPNDTNGCISLENKDIEELATLIKIFKTPIIIGSKIAMASPADIQKAKEEMTEIIENWRNAWQDRDIDRYMSFYNRRFTSGGKNWLQWKENKSQVANKYHQITVQVDDLRLLTVDGVVLATFKQTYSTPSFTTRGTKMLYLTKNSDQWKIVAETFDLEKIETAAAQKQEAYSLEDVENFIYSWKDAWEKEDLDKYIICYDEDFRSRGMDIAAWEEHRKKLNEEYRSLTIKISNLKIERISDNSARVTFMQNYTADSYKDIGNKELVLIKKDKDWKIKEEEWTPIKKK